MKLQFDANYNVEDFTIILSTRWYEHYGQIRNVKRDSVTCKQNMNAANELSFEVYKTLDGVDERLWDEIKDLKLVWVKELNEYYEINVSLDDSINSMKTITATSLCEAELSQVNLYNIEINSEADIARDAYEVTKFYNEENPKSSLLHRILDKVPNYSIKHVDLSLKNLQRTFSIDGTSIYDWLVGECSEQFNCLFVFDTTDRSISAYDLYTVCKDCGHRGEYEHICPECNSENLKYFGEDTTIFVSVENLTDSVKFETDIGSVKNCFKLEAGDEDMTATVRLLNPNGTDYIYYISNEQKEDMPVELVEKIESYDVLVESYTDEYEQLVEDMQDVRTDISYYTHSMMPTIEHAEVTASTEAAKLTAMNLSPLALTSVTESTSKSTVESALKNYAKVYVKTGYVKLDVHQSEFTYIGEQSDGWNHGAWTGNFKVTNYSDEEDVVESEVITIDIYDNYEEFVRQKIMKSIANDNDEEGSVFDVLSIDELDDFKAALELYCLVRLQSFYDAIQGALDVLIELDQASEEADLYSVLYEPYYAKLEACQEEIDKRAKTIEDLETNYQELDARRNEIQKILNFAEYLGEDMYAIFCSYRREDTYSNDNYISDGLDNAETFDKAKDFIQKAKEELYKSAMRQHSISSTLHNLLIMPEFEVIVDKFELGNWIRISVDEKIYRLRLISFEINFSEIQTLNVEFSDVEKQIDCVSDIQSILDSAQSMATNFSYISKQAEKGETAQKTFEQMKEEGLDSALIQINNNVHEEITYGKHGLLARSYDDMIDDYDPEQLKITHNILCFTDNNWKSVNTALGKHDYYKYDISGNLIKDTAYGLTSDFVTAGYINGSQIISGDIYSNNYSPTSGKGAHIDLNNGSFSLADSKIVYDNESNKLTFKEVTIEWQTSTAPDVSEIPGLETQLSTINTNITKAQTTADSAKGIAENAENIGDNLVSGLGFKETEITGKYVISPVIAGGALLIGDKNNTYAEITTDGVLNCTGANISGTVTADKGMIGSWNITDGALYDYDGTIETMGAGMQSWWCNTENEIQNADISFWAGAPFANRYLAPFLVKVNGDVTANNLTTNNITATGGNIGGCLIEDGVLQIGNVNIGEKLTANSIDATDLQVAAANVTGTLTASQIDATNLKVAAANVTGQLTASQINTAGLIAENISGTTITGKTISGGEINIGNGVFKVSSAGSMTSTSGKIAGWTIGSTSLTAGTQGSSGFVGLYTSYPTDENYRLIIGTKFQVNRDGELFASGGKIGNFYIESGKLSAWKGENFVAGGIQITPTSLILYSSTKKQSIPVTWETVFTKLGLL